LSSHIRMSAIREPATATAAPNITVNRQVPFESRQRMLKQTMTPHSRDARRFTRGRNVVDNARFQYFNRVTLMVCSDAQTAALLSGQGVRIMKEAIIVRKKQAAELRRMAETAREAERERKLLVLAERWDEEARHLEEDAR
jgi:hypothetical protein